MSLPKVFQIPTSSNSFPHNRLFQVVNTKQLVNSLQDVLLTDRVACFADQEQEMNLLNMPNFPKNNLLYRVFNEKTKLPPDLKAERKLLQNDHCFLHRDPSLEGLSTSDRVFFLGSQTMLSFMLTIMAMVPSIREKGIWISGETLFEYNLVRTTQVSFLWSLNDFLKNFFVQNFWAKRQLLNWILIIITNY